MTFDERVSALAPLGFTPRQTRFLVTAALHSGYCLRRHYLTFTGVRHGKNVRDFFETLVRRQLGATPPLSAQPWADLSPPRHSPLPGACATRQSQPAAGEPGAHRS
jgi:hypothetical protein